MTTSTVTTDETQVRTLYQHWIDAWNNRDAQAMAGLAASSVNLIGFDGSQMNSQSEIAAELGRIFADHPTATYTPIIREVRLLSPDVAILRAVVGMVPPGASDIKPEVNAIQSLVAVKEAGQWHITLFQNTPAAFHGRPELSDQLTAELRQTLKASR